MPLNHYLENGTFEVDNNLIENAINPSEYLHETLEALPTMKQREVADWTPALEINPSIDHHIVLSRR